MSIRALNLLLSECLVVDFDYYVRTMSPSTVGDPERSVHLSPDGFTNSKASKFRLDRHLRRAFPDVVSGKGNYLFTKDGRAVFDASTGAAVSCLGHGNERVLNTIRDQLTAGIPYLATTFWGSDIVEELCKELISGTDGAMARVYLTGSGMLCCCFLCCCD